MTSKGLSVQEALHQANLIEGALASFEQTAPQAVAALGGRDGLLAACQMTCVGPVPRLDQDTWETASLEYEQRRHAQHS